ncbi:hypothetical protein ACFT8P_33405 [Streptomyces sp. NPDC057101]|uniref:hypothetical protein n=1 Tax=Streptomyces sp. NPDC057101 TaxID=3346020 RepID=UPI003630BB1A
MSSVPITAHRPSPSEGRRVTAHRPGHDEILGIAYSDHDLTVFLDRAGVPDPDAAIDDPAWVVWRGAPAHQRDAA